MARRITDAPKVRFEQMAREARAAARKNRLALDSKVAMAALKADWDAELAFCTTPAQEAEVNRMFQNAARELRARGR